MHCPRDQTQKPNGREEEGLENGRGEERRGETGEREKENNVETKTERQTARQREKRHGGKKSPISFRISFPRLSDKPRTGLANHSDHRRLEKEKNKSQQCL